jgi:hypothetical protein
VLVDLCLAFFLPTHAETEPEIDWDARLSQNNLVTGIFHRFSCRLFLDGRRLRICNSRGCVVVSGSIGAPTIREDY